MKIFALIKAVLCAAFFYAGTTYAQEGPYRVTGTGSSYDLAKQNGFRQAIERYAGVVIVSNSELQNDKLVKDEILNYSSGYVDNYTIVNQYQVNRTYFMVMDVWVLSSKISQRILSTTSSTAINGNLFAERNKTFLEARAQSDALILTTLERYPHNAFNVTVFNTNFGIDASRQIFVNINYQVHWNQHWLAALNETLMITNPDEKQTPVYKVVFWDNPSAWQQYNRYSYYNLYEPKMHYNFRLALQNNSPKLKVTFYNHNRVLYSQCQGIDESKLLQKNTAFDRANAVIFYNHNMVKDQLTITIPNNTIVENTTEVKTEIVGAKLCR